MNPKTTTLMLTDISFEDLDELFADLGQLARLEGILDLNQFLSGVKDPFILTAIQLAVDGTEPQIMTRFLKSWMRSLMHEQEAKYRKVIGGIRSVQSGDNPVFTKKTLSFIY